MSDFFTSSSWLLTAGSLARASQINDIVNAIASGFDLLPSVSNLKLGLSQYGADSGAANAHVVTMPYTPTAYTDGMVVVFKAAATNTSTAVTMNVDSLGSVAIRNFDGSALEAGDIVANKFVVVRYNSTSGCFELQAGGGGGSSSLTSAQVKSLYEANSDTNAFTDADESKLDGIAAGATVGATWGSNITGQPTDLSGINSTEGTKLSGIESGADVTPSFPSDENLFGLWAGDVGQGGIALDSSGNGNHGTLTNGVSWGVNGIAGKCFDFDGNNDYIDLGVQGITGSRTFAAWIFVDVAAYTAKDYYILADRISTTHGSILYINGNNGLLYFINYNAGTSAHSSTPTTIPLQTWVHIAFVYDASTTTITFYINGIQAGSQKTTQTDNAASTISMAIGNWSSSPDPARAFEGYIAQPRLYQRALTASETKSLCYWPHISNKVVTQQVSTSEITAGTETDLRHYSPADIKGFVDTHAAAAAYDGDAIHDNEAGEISALTEKTTPVSADVLILEDSENSYAKRKVQIGNLPGGGTDDQTASEVPFTPYGDLDATDVQAAIQELDDEKEAADATILKQADVDDTPVNGADTVPVSSNWAYDHAAAADPHTGYMLESNIGTGANNYIQLDSSSRLPAVDGSQLTGVVTSEADPVVGAVSGIVKADGAGNISAAAAGTDYQAVLSNPVTSDGATTVENQIPQFTGTNNQIKDSLGLVATVGDPGSDSNLVSEQGIREAIDAHMGIPMPPSVKTANYTVLSTDYGTLICANSASDLTMTLGDGSADGQTIGFAVRGTGDCIISGTLRDGGGSHTSLTGSVQFTEVILRWDETNSVWYVAGGSGTWIGA